MNQLPTINLKKLSEERNVTFIIGNGFDLGLGLKTRYINIYEGYIKSTSSSENISKFKSELAKQESNNYENWSDFEMGMAEYAKKLSSENELVECVRDFKGYMVKHLSIENGRFLKKLNDDSSYAIEINKEFQRSLKLFYNGLIPNVVNQINGILGDYTINRNYITFNYTDSLEACIALRNKYNTIIEKPPIHIHGRLREDVVLGIDNIFQIKNLEYDITEKTKKAFIKTYFNERFDKKRVDDVKEIIRKSNVICVFGFSMGDSDKTWRCLLKEWLQENSEHHLVLYQYDEAKYNLYNRDEIMDAEDEAKKTMLDKFAIKDENILKQIHIPIGFKIFDFYGVEESIF